MAYQPDIMKSVVSDAGLLLLTSFSAFPSSSELFQDLSQLQETWLAEGECF